MSEFKFARMNLHAHEPVRAHQYDAGMDIFACESVIVPAHDKAIINTGIAISFPNDCYARIAPRSGLALKKSIDVLAGVIDHGYTGEVKVILFNHSDEPFEVTVHDRIAQLIFERIYIPNMLTCVPYNNIVDDAKRGENGFGSTGV
jgi:dUTP pyrophosphatase